MKRSIKTCTLIIACFIASSSLYAAPRKVAASAPAETTGQAFYKGAFYLGGALGLGSGLGYFGGFAGIANAEYAITNDIGLGASVGYWSYSEDLTSFGYTVSYKYSIIPIIASGAWHFHIWSPKFDLGAGVSLGYYIVNASSSVSGGSSVGTTTVAAATGSGVAFGVFGLVRYFVTDHLALRGKVGYGITVAEVGVDFRF